jgi:hypothetical protein
MVEVNFLMMGLTIIAAGGDSKIPLLELSYTVTMDEL